MTHRAMSKFLTVSAAGMCRTDFIKNRNPGVHGKLSDRCFEFVFICEAATSWESFVVCTQARFVLKNGKPRVFNSPKKGTTCGHSLVS